MNNPKTKILCVLHRPPPEHGAAVIGKLISDNENFNNEFQCHYITIESSETISDIGTFNFKKIILFFKLFFKVSLQLLSFRPNKVYFTSSIKGFAFYRDLILSFSWRFYKLFKSIDIYHHYHTKGVQQFVAKSKRNLSLTSFFLKDVNLILLSPKLEKDFELVRTFKKVFILPNCIEHTFSKQAFDICISEKYKSDKQYIALFMGHMLESKGYLDVLQCAIDLKNDGIHFYFAGGWADIEDERNFNDIVNKENISHIVHHHGFVSGEQKENLFKEADIFIYPTKDDAFPLVLIEALSYGLPILSSNEGGISSILDDKCGYIFEKNAKISNILNNYKKNSHFMDVALYCRQRYDDNFSKERFEGNLLKIFNA
jgi:glycosyltransferase involved in cell wall biosynthesis